MINWIILQQAYEKCFQNLHYIERHEEHTIAHAVQTNYKKTKVQDFSVLVCIQINIDVLVQRVWEF